MKWLILILVLLCERFYVEGQSLTINGIIRDEKELPVPYVTIQLMSNETKLPIAHTITDLFGKYILILHQYGNYEILVNSLGFASKKSTVSFNAQSSSTVTLNFNLEINPVAFKEVVISPQAYGRITTDTINYYIRQYTDGSERVLKDILSKLPGIEIKDNGRITANGKDVDKLLVDGEDFFFDQPKMASENLSAVIVNNVQLLNNYYNNPLQKDFNQNGLTVLNIGLKNEFKGKLMGDFSIGGGFQDKYSIHSNAINFSKKIKVGLICDVNNTGSDAYSFNNINDMTRGVAQLIQNDGSRESVTQFNQTRESIGMNSGSNAKSRNSSLVGFNMNYRPNQKIKLNSNFILNWSNRNEYEDINRNYILADENMNSLTKIDNKRKIFLGSTYIDASYRWSEKLLIAYKANLGVGRANEGSFITDLTLMDSSFYKQNMNGMQWSFNQFLNLTNKINDKSLIGLNFFQETNKVTSALNLFSDSLFLGLPMAPSSNYEVMQNFCDQKNLIGTELSYTLKFGKTLIKSIAGFNSTTLPLSSRLSKSFNSGQQIIPGLSGFNNDMKYENKDLRFELSWIKNKGLFQFSIGPALHYYLSAVGDSAQFSRVAISPNVKILLKFREGHDLMAGYQLRNQLPGSADLADGTIVNNFRTMLFGGMSINNYSINQTLSLHYVFFDIFSGTLITSNLRYSKSDFPVTTSMTTNTNYNLVKSIIGSSAENYYCQAALDKRLGAIPLVFSVKGIFSESTFDNYLNNNVNKIRLLNWQFGSVLSTRFAFPVNAEIGTDYRYATYKSALAKETGRFGNYKPYIRMTGTFKNGVSVNTNFSQSSFTTKLQNKNSWVLDIDIRFKPLKQKVEIFLNASNLLHIDDYKWVDTRYEQNYFEEREFRILPGYILTGITYRFR